MKIVFLIDINAINFEQMAGNTQMENRYKDEIRKVIKDCNKYYPQWRRDGAVIEMVIIAKKVCLTYLDCL